MSVAPLVMPVPTAKALSPLLEDQKKQQQVRPPQDLPERPSSALEAISRGREAAQTKLAVFQDVMMFTSYAAQALSHDEFSKCFEPKPTIQPQKPLLYWLYLLGMAIRYGILFPMRLGVLLMATFVFFLLLPICHFWGCQRTMRWLFKTYCRAWLFSFSAIIRHHGRKPTPTEPHIFVSNHTSFIDYFLISSHEFPHATVAQVHGGLFGLLQKYVLYLNGSLFFNRNEQKDRLAVSQRMQAHIRRRPQVAPLIIFPEGTCVNNESTVLFHKGAFDLDALVCPIAIKYNKRLLDPYWNTREQTFTQHIFYIMTRWFMLADVWWLPPQRRQPDESAIQFAERVKALISETAGLRNLSWDGYMKNCMRLQDHEKMRRSSQEKYVSFLRKRFTPAPSMSDESLEDLTSQMPNTSAVDMRPKKGAGRVTFLNPIPSMSFAPGSFPSNFSSALHIPSWLSDAAITGIKNELMMANSDVFSPVSANPSAQLIQHIRNRKDDLVRTWKYYTRMSRQSPMPTNLSEEHFNFDAEFSAHVADRRLENSSWRFWFKQRIEEQSGPSSGASDYSSDYASESVSPSNDFPAGALSDSALATCPPLRKTDTLVSRKIKTKRVEGKEGGGWDRSNGF